MASVKETFIRRLPLPQREKARQQDVGLSPRVAEGEEKKFVQRTPLSMRDKAETQAITESPTGEERLKAVLLETGTIGDESTVDAPHSNTKFGSRLSPEESIEAGATGAVQATTDVGEAASEAASEAANVKIETPDLTGPLVIVGIIIAGLIALSSFAKGAGRGVTD